MDSISVESILGQRIREMMEVQRRTFLDGLSLERLREMWDGVTDDVVTDQSGVIYDCDDIHAALNRRGDGKYCAV